MPKKQKLDTVDTNINNYSTEELLRVLDLDVDNPNKEEMIKTSNKYIQKFKNGVYNAKSRCSYHRESYL